MPETDSDSPRDMSWGVFTSELFYMERFFRREGEEAWQRKEIIMKS